MSWQALEGTYAHAAFTPPMGRHQLGPVEDDIAKEAVGQPSVDGTKFAHVGVKNVEPGSARIGQIAPWHRRVGEIDFVEVRPREIGEWQFGPDQPRTCECRTSEVRPLEIERPGKVSIRQVQPCEIQPFHPGTSKSGAGDCDHGSLDVAARSRVQSLLRLSGLFSREPHQESHDGLSIPSRLLGNALQRIDTADTALSLARCPSALEKRSVSWLWAPAFTSNSDRRIRHQVMMAVVPSPSAATPCRRVRLSSFFAVSSAI